jgi:hypothetical protein
MNLQYGFSIFQSQILNIASMRLRIGFNSFMDGDVPCKFSLFPRQEWILAVHDEITNVLHQNS